MSKILRLVFMVLAFASATAGAVRAQTVSGVLTDLSTGQPLSNAPVILVDGGGSERVRSATDAAGRFLLEAPAAGAYWLRSRPVGFQPVESRPFVLDRGDTLRISLSTQEQVALLEGVTVTGARQNRNYAGFLDRARLGFGRFVGPEVVRRQVFGGTAESLAALAPGVLDFQGSTMVLRNRGRRCAPEILLDGVRFRGAIAEIMSSTVRAVEVYDIPSLVPPELSATPFNNCGVVAVWTAWGLGIE